MNNLHKRIREVMDEKGWEPPEVAKICGFKTPHAIYFWLDGSTHNLKHDSLLKFCRAAGIQIDWLISGELPKYKSEKLRKLEINFKRLGTRQQELLYSTSNTLAQPDDDEDLPGHVQK